MEDKRISYLEHVFKAACEAFDNKPIEVLSPCRKQVLADSRKAFAYLMLNCSDKKYSLHELGFFINRDHSTIVACNKQAKDLIITDRYFKNKIEALKTQLINQINFTAIPQF